MPIVRRVSILISPFLFPYSTLAQSEFVRGCQVTELLYEAGVDYKKQTKLEEFLHALKDFMDKLPDAEVSWRKELARGIWITKYAL